MEPRINVITLAVDDLERALTFYREGLGLHSPGVIGTEFVGDDEHPSGAVAMFELDGGLVLALYPRTELAKDANLPVGTPESGEFSIGQLVPSKIRCRRTARPSRGERCQPRRATTGPAMGDLLRILPRPDGHLWEIIWNPRLELG
jgi:uncharacterized protein